MAGVVSKGPHPEAGKLFIDWLMSLSGQTHYQNSPFLYYGSARKDAPAMPDAMRLRDYKLLAPSGIAADIASHDTSNKERHTALVTSLPCPAIRKSC